MDALEKGKDAGGGICGKREGLAGARRKRKRAVFVGHGHNRAVLPLIAKAGKKRFAAMCGRIPKRDALRGAGTEDAVAVAFVMRARKRKTVGTAEDEIADGNVVAVHRGTLDAFVIHPAAVGGGGGIHEMNSLGLGIQADVFKHHRVFTVMLVDRVAAKALAKLIVAADPRNKVMVDHHGVKSRLIEDRPV